MKNMYLSEAKEIYLGIKLGTQEKINPPNHHAPIHQTHAWPSSPVISDPNPITPNLYGTGLHDTAAAQGSK